MRPSKPHPIDPPWTFATARRVRFGAGLRDEVAGEVRALGRRALVVTGQSALRSDWLMDRLEQAGVVPLRFRVDAEPTVDVVRRGVAEAREHACDVVVACGGGAALDTGKAIAALLGNGGDVLDYIEVVGRGETIARPSLPFVAVPTTAGTGAEVTRNAVVAVPDARVKASLRSDHMLPDLALVDPELSHSMPAAVTASTGLDALTHLIESYVSSGANPLTDVLCRDAIPRAAWALRRAYHDGDDVAARAAMAHVSLAGGFALANAGLGAVHAFAGPAGGMWKAPHGCLCGRFLPFVIERNVAALEARATSPAARTRFTEIAGWLTSEDDSSPGDGVDWIQALCEELPVPTLSAYGASREELPALVERAKRATGMRTNPVALSDDELFQIAMRALD